MERRKKLVKSARNRFESDVGFFAYFSHAAFFIYFYSKYLQNAVTNQT